MPQHEKRFRIISILLSLLILLVLSFALFDPTNAITFDNGNKYKQALNLPDTNPESLGIRVLQYGLGFLGLLAVTMVMFGGIMWMTSAGNEQRVQKGKDILKWAVLGMVVILLSWAIIIFLFEGVGVIN
ncbi:MAG: pilin [Parcubacteria group bacterium]